MHEEGAKLPGGGAIVPNVAKAAGAQSCGQCRHHQALVGAERARVGIRLGLHVLSKPDDDTGTSRGGKACNYSGRDASPRRPRRVQRRNGSPPGRLGEASLPKQSQMPLSDAQDFSVGGDYRKAIFRWKPNRAYGI